jgi:orotate phosphoribosyltransferase
LSERDRLLELLKTKALELRQVTLSSGQTSNYYIDCKRVTLSSEGAYLAARIFLDMIEPEAEAVGGLTLGADPLVASIVALSHIDGRNLQGLIVRKEPKKHGTMSYVEGPTLEMGAKVAVIEDVVTSGASILRAIERIEAAGYQPVQALAIFDRQEGGRDALQDKGYRLQSIYTREDLNLSP